MKKAQIVTVSYDEFLKQLVISKRNEACVEPLDKAQWAEQVLKRDLKATAFSMVAANRYQAEELFLLTGDEPWDGLFAIDRETRTAIRFTVTEV